MKVSVVKADNYNIEIVDKAVNDAVNLIGGWQNFIKKGDKVLIKPNMLTNVTPEKAVTTHPEVVRAVIKAVKNMGALPAVGDSPGISNLKSKQSKAYNYMEGRFIKQFELVDCLSDFDKIISVAKMKTHVFMGVTGAVKNLFGCIVGTDKARFHLRMQKHIDFAHVMVDLYQTIKPTLNIIDGITAMEGQGPMSGDVVDAKIIIASSDGFAADLIMADKMGFDAEAMPIAAAGIEEKRIVHLKDIKVVGDGKDEQFHFVKPHTSMQDTYLPKFILKLGQNQLTSKPVINKNCVACGRCSHHCPPKAITIIDKKVNIDYQKCIRCYCCQELCPHQAVDLKDGLILSLLKYIGIYK